MKLHRVTVTFDRVFDIVQARGYETPAHTLFGFEASSRRYYGVKVPGHPRIEVGDTVTALLSNPSNWQTLQGWVNHETREIAAPSVGGGGITSAAMFIAGAFCFYITGFTANSLLAVPFVLGGTYWLWYTIAATLIQKELKQDGA